MSRSGNHTRSCAPLSRGQAHSAESRVSGLTETTNNPSEQVPVQLGDVPSRKKAVTECATRVLKTVKRSAGNLGRFPKDLFPEHKERYQDMNMRFIQMITGTNLSGFVFFLSRKSAKFPRNRSDPSAQPRNTYADVVRSMPCCRTHRYLRKDSQQTALTETVSCLP